MEKRAPYVWILCLLLFGICSLNQFFIDSHNRDKKCTQSMDDIISISRRLTRENKESASMLQWNVILCGGTSSATRLQFNYVARLLNSSRCLKCNFMLCWAFLLFRNMACMSIRSRCQEYNFRLLSWMKSYRFSLFAVAAEHFETIERRRSHNRHKRNAL